MSALFISSRWTQVQAIPPSVVVADARLSNYFTASAFTILLIDFYSTIDEEINFVWKKPWSPPTVLYLWNRYITLFTVILSMPFMFREVESDHSCRSFIIAQGLASTLLFGSFDLLLMLRVWILYGKTRLMARILFPMLFVEMLSMIVILLLPETYLRGPVLPGCYFTTSPMTGAHFAFYAFPPLLVTFAIFVLTVYKCLKTIRRSKKVDMPIVTLFLRDGIVWFIVVFFFYGSELIIWASARATLTQTLIMNVLTRSAQYLTNLAQTLFLDIIKNPP
ncbi:hypothetical protein C8R46DRAFT_1192107 [Mycena filopes]|nr:hypothetical protein C8R46DRAFT_1192107 [Mycena filopes]